MELRIVCLQERAELPRYATEGSACMDIAACLEQPVTLKPQQRALIDTGLALEIPQGHVGLLFARSGQAVNRGLSLINGVGVIDSDYRGPLKVGMINLGETALVIAPGERIAQLGVFPVERAVPVEVLRLGETARGAGGFGSTGTDNNANGEEHRGQG